jgi:hypothetical protein
MPADRLFAYAGRLQLLLGRPRLRLGMGFPLLVVGWFYRVWGHCDAAGAPADVLFCLA